MPIRHAFISAKSDGADPTEVQPSHWNADHVDDDDNPVSGSGWSEEHEQANDQIVSASTALVDATGLFFAVTTLSLWRVEVELIYSGTSTTGDFRCNMTVTSGTMTGWQRHIGSDSTADAINVSTGLRLASLATSSFTAGTDASGSLRSIFIEAMLRFSANATFKIQFTQVSATGTTTLKAGSTLRGRRMI